MMEVKFYEIHQIEDRLLKYAVIAAEYQNKWICCRHKARCTWEIPGGHRETGECIEETARRELWEETGAVNASVCPLAVYGVDDGVSETFGMLFYAKVIELEALKGENEIGEIAFHNALPTDLTYPEIQPHLFQYVLRNQDQYKNFETAGMK